MARGARPASSSPPRRSREPSSLPAAWRRGTRDPARRSGVARRLLRQRRAARPDSRVAGLRLGHRVGPGADPGTLGKARELLRGRERKYRSRLRLTPPRHSPRRRAGHRPQSSHRGHRDGGDERWRLRPPPDRRQCGRQRAGHGERGRTQSRELHARRPDHTPADRHSYRSAARQARSAAQRAHRRGVQRAGRWWHDHHVVGAAVARRQPGRGYCELARGNRDGSRV